VPKKLPAMDEYGCVETKRNRETGTKVSVYHSESAGMETYGGDTYHAVCEDHGTMMPAASLTSARSAAYDAGSWCDDCKPVADAKREAKENPNLGRQFE
jgi:hypothetical protein